MRKIYLMLIVIITFLPSIVSSYGGGGGGAVFLPLKADNQFTVFSHTLKINNITSYSFYCHDTITKGILFQQKFTALYQCPINYPLNHFTILLTNTQINNIKIEVIIFETTKNSFRNKKVLSAGYIKTRQLDHASIEVVLNEIPQDINIYVSKDLKYWTKTQFILENNKVNINMLPKNKFFIITR